MTAWRKLGWVAATLVAAPLLLGGTAMLARSCAPSSRTYRPNSPLEERSFARARRDWFPRDATQRPDAGQPLVAWAGVLRHFETAVEGEALVFRFDVEHRYFDWIEDRGLQTELYFLSPHGEGMFRAAWGMERSAGEAARAHVAVGDMLVVYGVPEVSDAGLATYPTEYVRLVPRGLWTDGRLDYGRPSEGIGFIAPGPK